MNKTMLNLRFLIVTALTGFLACTACTPREHVVKQYQKDGVQFSYYSDWTVVKDAPVSGKPDVRAIHIEGPEHAVVSLICAPPSSSQTLEEFAAAVAEKRPAAIEGKLSVGPLKPAEVSIGTSEPTTGRVAGQDQQGILQRFNISLLGTQVPHEARFYVVHGSTYKVMVMSQVATAKAAATHSASELILDSLAIAGAP